MYQVSQYSLQLSSFSSDLSLPHNRSSLPLKEVLCYRMNHYPLRHKMAGLDGNPTPSLAGPPGSVRKSHLWLDFAKELGIGIVSGVITTALTALLWKFVISKLINYCVGERVIPDAAPPPNPTPADFVGVHIEGEPKIPYEAPVDCDNKGEPAIPDAAPPPNPPLSLLTLWRSFTVVLTNNFIARLNKRAAAEPAAPLEIDREPSIV